MPALVVPLVELDPIRIVEVELVVLGLLACPLVVAFAYFAFDLKAFKMRQLLLRGRA